MQFKDDAHRQAYEKTRLYLNELFAEAVHSFDEVPAFAVTQGSAVAFVRVLPWRDTAAVRIRVCVATGVPLSPDLLRFLLRANAESVFGAFGLDEDGDIVLEHAIAASDLGLDELREAVIGALRTAEEFSGQIVQRFGGMPAAERLRPWQ